MARTIKITVKNNTNKVLTLRDNEAKHGKFTSYPPTTIESSGSWSLASRSGPPGGLEGTATYGIDGGSVTIEFYFNQPMGVSSSSYRVTPNPFDSIGYDIKGSFKGHDQNITFELYSI